MMHVLSGHFSQTLGFTVNVQSIVRVRLDVAPFASGVDAVSRDLNNASDTFG